MERSSQKASTGQVLELVNIVTKAIANAVKKNSANSEEVQKLISNPGVLYKYFETLLSESKTILKPIVFDKKIMIEASDGKSLISKADRIFRSGIDQEFTNWVLNEAADATPETLLDVCEMVKDATFAQMFSELSPDMNKLVMTQSQIIRFCEKYRVYFCQEECITFFLTKVDCRFFVVYVCVLSDGLDVSVRRPDSKEVWHSKYSHRVVFPQTRS